MRLLVFVFAALLFAVTSAPSWAQDAAANKIIQPMKVIDPVTLQAGNTRITLWGIKAARASEAPIELKAIDLLEKMIGSEAVTCKVVGGAAPAVIARCAAHTNEDLGLELLSHGYAVMDRAQTADHVYTPPYTTAETGARQNKEGIWQLVEPQAKSSEIPGWLQLLLMWGPMAGLLIIGFTTHLRLKRMETLQQEEMEQARRKETALFTRERHVLVSTLEGELTENKNRIEAFLTIYRDMLQNLRNTVEAPKYQKAGDIIQKHPSLSRTIFESNVSKLSLLDMKLAAQLSKLYTSLPKEQEYINLEPSVSLETAVALVEKVLKEAQDMLPSIDQAIAALEEAVAQKKTA